MFIYYFESFCVVFVFFMLKTEYEMRISDWSSDVCSSDLAGLRVRDELHGHRGHASLEPAFGDEPFAKSGAGQMVREPEPEPAGDDDSLRALGQGDVAGNRAQRQAESIQRGGGQAVLRGYRRCPQCLLVAVKRRAILDRGEGFVDIGQPGAGGDPFRRDPSITLPKPRH